MRKFLALVLVLALALAGTAPAFARGSSGEDCPPGSTDPDCTATTAPPPGGGK